MRLSPTRVGKSHNRCYSFCNRLGLPPLAWRREICLVIFGQILGSTTTHVRRRFLRYKLSRKSGDYPHTRGEKKYQLIYIQVNNRITPTRVGKRAKKPMDTVFFQYSALCFVQFVKLSHNFAACILNIDNTLKFVFPIIVLDIEHSADVLIKVAVINGICRSHGDYDTENVL